MAKKLSKYVGKLYRKSDSFTKWLKKEKGLLENERLINDRIKRISGGAKKSQKEFEEVVLSYWKRYGIKPQKKWFDLYCDGKDSYDPRYITDPIWLWTIIPYFNRMEFRDAYADKGMFNRLITGVKKPDTIVKNIAGYYYNGDGEQIISLDSAIGLCEAEDRLIIKPSGLSKGKGIVFYERSNDLIDLRKTFAELKKDFVVQRVVKQHSLLAELNESSLNTIRVLSFHFKGEVFILSAQLRIGASGARVDNVAAGGCAVAIKPDGWLYEKSVTRKSAWTDTAPNGKPFKDIKIPNYQGIIDTIKRLHCQLPYFGIIGWDFAVGEDETPIMIEYNVRPAQNQIGCGSPSFGDITDEVLEEVFIKKEGPHF